MAFCFTVIKQTCKLGNLATWQALTGSSIVLDYTVVSLLMSKENSTLNILGNLVSIQSELKGNSRLFLVTLQICQKNFEWKIFCDSDIYGNVELDIVPILTSFNGLDYDPYSISNIVYSKIDSSYDLTEVITSLVTSFQNDQKNKINDLRSFQR